MFTDCPFHRLADSPPFGCGFRHAVSLRLCMKFWACFFLLAALWLGGPCSALALQWEQGDGFRRATVSVPASGKVGLTLLTAAQTGIGFTNHLSDAKAAENQIRLNGSG